MINYTYLWFAFSILKNNHFAYDTFIKSIFWIFIITHIIFVRHQSVRPDIGFPLCCVVWRYLHCTCCLTAGVRLITDLTQKYARKLSLRLCHGITVRFFCITFCWSFTKRLDYRRTFESPISLFLCLNIKRWLYYRWVGWAMLISLIPSFMKFEAKAKGNKATNIYLRERCSYILKLPMCMWL